MKTVEPLILFNRAFHNDPNGDARLSVIVVDLPGEGPTVRLQVFAPEGTRKVNFDLYDSVPGTLREALEEAERVRDAEIARKDPNRAGAGLPDVGKDDS